MKSLVDAFVVVFLFIVAFIFSFSGKAKNEDANV